MSKKNDEVKDQSAPVVKKAEVESKLKYMVLKNFCYHNGTDVVNVRKHAVDDCGDFILDHLGQRTNTIIEEKKSLAIPFIKAKALEEIYEDFDK